MTADATEAIETRGALEDIVVEQLRKRGWEVIEARRDQVDLDLVVAWRGTRGGVRLRNAFEVPRGVARPASSPAYLRVDLGQPQGEPSRWAVWDRYEFPTGKQTPRYCAEIFHEAIGEGWASVAGRSVAPQYPWYAAHRTVNMLLARAEALAPGRDEATRREQIFLTQRRNFGAQAQRAREIVTVVVLFAMAALATAVLVFGLRGVLSNAKEPTQTVLGGGFVSVMFGVPALICAIMGLVTLIRLLRTPRSPLEGAAEVARMLRSSGVFTRVTTTPRKDRDGLPVVVRAGGYLEEGEAPLSLSRLLASSSDHSLVLEADLCRVSWPEGAQEARFVPDRWLTADLSGDGAELTRLPPGPREDRRDGVVRWTFTGEEIDAGAVQDQLLQVAAALGAGGGPYR